MTNCQLPIANADADALSSFPKSKSDHAIRERHLPLADRPRIALYLNPASYFDPAFAALAAAGFSLAFCPGW